MSDNLLSIGNLILSHFGFEDRILVLIVPVPDHCLSSTFQWENNFSMTLYNLELHIHAIH